jgi:hypothetical protein
MPALSRIVKNIKYNLAQLIFILSTAKIRVLEFGRGTGKSTILAKYIIDCVTEMPRSTGAIVAASFAQIKTRTLPSTIQGLEMHGYIEGVHYFVGKKAPDRWQWPLAYEPPLDYRNAITFWNGTVLTFISQDGAGSSGRGLNIDWGFADEAALLNEQKFETDFLLSMRGGKKKMAIYPDGTFQRYEHCQWHHSFVLASTTPITLDGRWFLKYEMQAQMNPAKVAFFSASSEVNIENLGAEYFERAKALLPDFLYKAEILNQRIPKIDNGFYPLLNENRHTYGEFTPQDLIHSHSTCKQDKDLREDEPLLVGIDWGTSINCMVVAQGNRHAIRFVNNLYVKKPLIIDDLVRKFVKYYAPRKNKQIMLWYDPTGNINTANSRITFAEQVVQQLTAAGWQVRSMTTGRANELHESKYNLWNNILKEDSEGYPSFSMNRKNCKELWISMTSAPAIVGRSESIKKDKKSERNKSVQQEHATHFSDAADIVIVGMYKELLFGKKVASGFKTQIM